MRPDITRVAYLLSPLRDNPIPIYVYDSTGSNLLYLFISKTILYADFNISNRTLKIHLNTGVLYLNLFLLSTELLKTASEENMLTLEQLPPPPSTYLKSVSPPLSYIQASASPHCITPLPPPY